MKDLERIFRYMKPYRKQFILFVVIEASFELTIPMLMADMIDVGVANHDMDYIVERGMIMMGCALLALITGLIYARFSARAANGFGAALREAEYIKVQEYSFGNLDHFETSSLITRMTTDVTVMQNAVSGGLRPLVRSPVMLLMGLGMTFYLNRKLVLVFAVCIPILAFILYSIVSHVAPMYGRLQRAVDRVNAIVQENLNAIRVVKAFVRGEYEEEKFAQVNSDLKRTSQKTFHYAVLNLPAFQLVMYGAVVMILWFGGRMVQIGGMQVGELTGFLTYVQQIINSLMMIVVTFVSMVVLNLTLTGVVIVCIVCMLLVTRFLAGRSGRYFVRQQVKLGDLNGYIEEMINGQKVVKVFCHEEEAQEGFDRVNDALFESAYKANKYANILMPILINIGNIQYVVIAMVGGALALNGLGGGITLGVIASFLQLSKSLTNPISQISQQLNSVVMALAGAQRIFDLMDEPSEEDHGTVTLVNVSYNKDGALQETSERTNLWAWKVPQEDGSFAYTKLAGDVRFDDVDFAYEEGKTILHDISLFAKPGQKLAFVGATGAGKTTITNLINRFYDIADGKIHYDGISINDIHKPDLRRSLGIVLQDTNLFTGTVRENIRYGNLSATDEEVEAAAVLANADDFIRRLPQGYDTMLTGNGANLSQGQRQLIAIARAAVADPPVMILDEATSSIDTRTEAIVQRGMDSLMTGRTVFVIAHRLSTVRNSDAIMVLDHGRIVERGDHEDLIRQHGLYYQLYTGAFELE